MYEIKPPIESSNGTKLDNEMTYDPVGKPIKHKAADQQVLIVVSTLQSV